MTVDEALAALQTIEDPRMRAVNERHGDRHGVNLTGLRALAKQIKTDQSLALTLWAHGNPDGRLLATQICRATAFSADEFHGLARQIDFPKLAEWFVAVVKNSKHAEALRQRWKDREGLLGRMGWSLTAYRVEKAPDGLDVSALLDQIEAEMKDTLEHKQWTMNYCLAQIGIFHSDHRDRAIAIGEQLEVLKDYPTPRGCTPPFAPAWIAQLVRRQGLG